MRYIEMEGLSMIYVMSDIHGNMERFDSIMKQINLIESDTLYVLGDVIDRYSDGIKILRRLMKMDNVIMLLGNHEYMMLQSLNPYSIQENSEQERARALRLWHSNGGEITHNYIKHIRIDVRKEMFDYLKSLPLEYEIIVNEIKYLLVHASPVRAYNNSKYNNETEFAVWNRWKRGDSIPKEYTMIFGHTPTSFFRAIEPLQIWREGRAIAIDCGCGYFDGRLACLRLDDMKVFYSE